jgi:hypothetical protein
VQPALIGFRAINKHNYRVVIYKKYRFGVKGFILAYIPAEIEPLRFINILLFL